MSRAVQLYDKDGNPAYPRPYYRIGDFLESTNPNNPGDDGYIGIWELYGKGRVTVCIDSDDTDFDTIGKMSGEKEHTLTIDEMPKHNHNVNMCSSIGPYASPVRGSGNGQAWETSPNTISDKGNNQPHNNMPPYIVIYRWRRIA